MGYFDYVDRSDPNTVRKGPEPKKIDFEKVEYLASIGCNKTEISEALGISLSSLYNLDKKYNFQIFEAYQRGLEKHREIVLGGLTQAAKEKSVPALIFLAKAHFNRRDKEAPPPPESNVSTEDLQSLQEKIRLLEAEESIEVVCTHE